MVAQKSFAVSPARSILIALAVIAVLLLGALGLAAMSSGTQTSTAGAAAPVKAFPYGPADGRQDGAPAERTGSHGPR